jgi:imidazolonepropionase-like amidohydrolase
MNRPVRYAFAALGVLNAVAATADEVLFRGAKVHTVAAQGTLDDVDVLVRDGKIVSVGKGLPASSSATVVDGKGKVLTPGLFGGLANTGIVEIPKEPKTADATLQMGGPVWQQQWRPEFDVTLAYNPQSTHVPIIRIEGVTWTVLTPASDQTVIAGEGAAVSLDGRYDAVLAGSRSLFVQMGGEAAAQSGGSRAAQYMLLEQAIREVRTSGPMQEGALLHPNGRDALASYLRGGRVVFSANRASDIRTIVAFAARNGMKAVIRGAQEAWLVADELARADVPVILEAFNNLPASFDRLGARRDNAALLQQAGVRITFLAPYLDWDGRKIRQVAGNAVAHGLAWDAALAAITANPADIFGLGATRGRIAAGQIADLVLWSGDPLEVTTVAEQVWFAGHPVEMRSRQTELRDRYVEKVKERQAR